MLVDWCLSFLIPKTGNLAGLTACRGVLENRPFGREVRFLSGYRHYWVVFLGKGASRVLALGMARRPRRFTSWADILSAFP